MRTCSNKGRLLDGVEKPRGPWRLKPRLRGLDFYLAGSESCWKLFQQWSTTRRADSLAEGSREFQSKCLGFRIQNPEKETHQNSKEGVWL